MRWREFPIPGTLRRRAAVAARRACAAVCDRQADTSRRSADEANEVLLSFAKV